MDDGDHLYLIQDSNLLTFISLFHSDDCPMAFSQSASGQLLPEYMAQAKHLLKWKWMKGKKTGQGEEMALSLSLCPIQQAGSGEGIREKGEG